MHEQAVSRLTLLRRILLASAILVYLLIVAGGVVRATQSGGACLDWPTCFGAWTPPIEGAARVEYLHRLATLLATPVLLAASILVLRMPVPALLRRATIGATSLVLVQALVGGGLALELDWLPLDVLPSLHLLLSLLALAGVIVAVVLAFHLPQDAAAFPARRLIFSSPFGRLAHVTIVAMFLLLASGALVSAVGAGATCSGWPLCTPQPGEPAGWLALGHRLVVLLAGLVVLAAWLQAWRTRRSQPLVLIAATTTFVLYISQALLGGRLVAGFPTYLLALHEATAVAAWVTVVILWVATGLAPRTSLEETAEARDLGARRGMGRDLLMLTKPVVVALLLVTTFAGMVIGAQEWPAWDTALWTLLGGFMAAGGSGAINQYIDRSDDGKMQRTQKRPIPSGRLTPGEGLAFGVGLSVGSFYLMTAQVNFLAALLTLAGIIYYVLIYSLLLKKTTVQNIVIGGGAGAIPPLVGWAAATGSLNIPSLFLFAVVFMWTPPHFWALALVRAKDYARAGVPMLPVVSGEKETQKQILIYTLELVGLTLLLPVFGLGGSVYLVGAALLGLWLLAAAWKVWKEGGNKRAWKMYRYSSMYLAFLFLVLMVDRLL